MQKILIEFFNALFSPKKEEEEYKDPGMPNMDAVTEKELLDLEEMIRKGNVSKKEISKKEISEEFEEAIKEAEEEIVGDVCVRERRGWARWYWRI